MIKIEGPTELAKLESGKISKPRSPITVGALELALLERYPRGDAEPWDRTGLLVGDPAALVTGVLVALDPTARAIEAALQADANVVLTHHPAFLDAPTSFTPSPRISQAPGANVFKAASSGVALMNFHTALDVSAESTRMLPRMLNLQFERLLMPLEGDALKGYGSLCSARDSDAPFTLGRLAARCLSVFGRVPRVWGDPSRVVNAVVTANGSASGVVGACVSERVDCLVCGELRYHAALDASQAGLAVIELGHDSSELPLTAILARAAIEAGVEQSGVSVHDQSGNWWTPDSTRI